jgi:hypothetical protein
MTELLDAQFETYIDTKTGKQAIRVKQSDNGPDGNYEKFHEKEKASLFILDVKFEVVTDASGKQTLRMVVQIPTTGMI